MVAIRIMGPECLNKRGMPDSVSRVFLNTIITNIWTSNKKLVKADFAKLRVAITLEEAARQGMYFTCVYLLFPLCLKPISFEVVLHASEGKGADVKSWLAAIVKVLLILKRIPNAECQALYETHKADALVMAGGEDAMIGESKAPCKSITYISLQPKSNSIGYTSQYL